MNTAEEQTPDEIQKLASALEFHFGVVSLVGDDDRLEKVVEHVLSKSGPRSPSRQLWEQAVREHCQVDEEKKRDWPDHAQLNVLLFQLLKAFG